jgi:type I restriction enzyme S subunit
MRESLLNVSSEISKDWNPIVLGENAIIKGRIGWKGLKQSEYTNEGAFLVAGKHIKNGKINWAKCDHISDERYDESIEIALKIGDVIISKDGSLGNPALIDYLPEKATINSTMMLIRVNSNISSEFFYQILCSRLFEKLKKEKMSGSSIPHIFQRDMSAFNFLIPPLPKQQKIATILTTVDDKLENIEEQISQYTQLKKGLMQQLLTKGIGHTEFVDSPLGMIPKGWEVVKLGDVGRLGGGNAFKATDFNRDGVGYQVIRMSNVQPYGLELNKTPIYINSINEKESKYLLKRGDILITLTGTIGKTDYGNVAYIEESDTMVLNQRVGRFEMDDILFNKFIFFVFNSVTFKKQFFEHGKGGTGNQANVGKDGFETIKIVLPPLPEQKQIANILTSVDDKLELLQNQKGEYTCLKKGLLEQLLTGRVRVKV